MAANRVAKPNLPLAVIAAANPESYPGADWPSSYNGTKYVIEYVQGNLLGVAPGRYTFYISGWRWTTDDRKISDANVQLIVKASGETPHAGAEHQLPDPSHYGTNTNVGWQPPWIAFPVTHALFWTGFGRLAHAMRICFKNGGAVCFHCNKGKVRSPLLAALTLSSQMSTYIGEIGAWQVMTENIVPRRRI